MRKNRLIEEMNNVINKNNVLYSKCEELEKALVEKNQTIAELTSVNARITAENELLKAELASLNEMVKAENCDKSSNADIGFQEDATSTVADLVTPKSESGDKGPTLHENSAGEITPTFATTALMPESKIEAASQAIGRIVLKCAELCNTFASVGDINSKDLINLALGRTEVFKSEVLQLAIEIKDIDTLNSELAVKEAAVTEYFELLTNQL